MKKFLFYSIILSIFAINSLFAWGFHTHRKITADSVRLMPESFKSRFKLQKNSFLKGSTDPDMLIKDFTNHVYYPDGSHSSGMYRIKALYDNAVTLISKNQSEEQIAYVLGLMSHYIADLNQPLHTAGKKRDPNEGDYHSKYETDVNKHLKNLVFPTVFFNPVTSVENRVQKMTTEALRYYDEIGDSYRMGRGLAPLTKMSEKQINESIQNVTDFWMGAFKSAGVNLDSTTKTSNTDVEWDLKSERNNDPKAINVNRASADKIAEFFNISMAKAHRIVDGRPYRSAYDLAKTKVFSPMYIKRNKNKIKTK